MVASDTFRTGSEKTITMVLAPETLAASWPGVRPVIAGRFVSAVGRGVDSELEMAPLTIPVAVGAGVTIVRDDDAGEWPAMAASDPRGRLVAAGRADPDKIALPTGTATASTTVA